MSKIELTITELEAMLDEQKKVVGEYMTRNLSVYGDWWIKIDDLQSAKQSMKNEALKAGYVSEFEILKKYVK